MSSTRICVALFAALLFVPASFATTLSANFSGGIVGGQPTPPSGISAELAAITNFGGPNTGATVEAFDGTPNLGATAFIQNGSFYVGSNRAYGFAGPGRSDITFAPGVVSEISLQVRGSDGQSAGGNALTVSPGPLGTSDVTLLIWSNLGVQSTTQNISNTGFQTISLDVNTVPGDFISRVSLINESTDPRSLAFIGTISVTTVPEPATVLLSLVSVAGVGVLRRRR